MPYFNYTALYKFLLLLILLWSAITLVFVNQAFAEPVDFDLPAQPLAKSLKDFGRITGVTISSDSQYVSGKNAPALSGRMEPEKALEQLLKGSGLRSSREANSIIIEPTLSADHQLDVELKAVDVRAQRHHGIGPMPGLSLAKDQIPGNVQSITAQDIKDSNALGVADLMNSRLQSVNVNDYQGNPFQMDVTYRGFTAGPQLGTPQGLSVFFDGIRVNEPFGDVVNWDMLPLNAISNLDVFPGSNPIFGLNTLGGALSIKTRSGFDGDVAAMTVTGGAFGRKQLQAEVGGNNGVIAGFAAATIFDEDGWRDNSPSKVNQVFGKLEWQNDKIQLGLSSLYAGNDLIGNGLIPKELYDQNPETVFTSPDQTKNRLLQFQISGAFEVSDTFNITSQIYRRKSKRRSLNGDFYGAFDEMSNDYDYGRETSTPANNLPLCQWVDADGDGRIDPPYIALNAPCNSGTSTAILEPLELRNGAASFTQTGAGIINGTPIGQIDKTAIDQLTKGAGIQFNWNLEKHKFMVGASLDSASADYGSTSQLALIDASHNVYLDPDNIDPLYWAASNPVTNNSFDGTSRTLSLYFSETWMPVERWSLSASARYNKTKIVNDLKSRTGAGFSELHNVRDFPLDFILCPTSDPTSCPTEPNASSVSGYSDGVDRRNTQFLMGGQKEKFSYYSLNPSLGTTFSPSDNLNLYANWNQGTRVPSVIELGCAFDKTAPFSGGACTLPSTMSGDPYLPQIKATTTELGMRGVFSNGWNWNTSVYRTELKDDIYFVGFTPTRSYFDTIGDTLRKGLEFGLSGSVGKADFSLNYGLTSATFESPFWMSNIANSSTDRDINGGNQPGLYPYDFDWGGVIMPENPSHLTNHKLPTYRLFKVKPGARMPGIPLHNLNFTFNYRATERWNIGFNVIARSSAIARGNENNKHRAGPATIEDGPLICNDPIFDDDGNFTGNFYCAAQPAFFRPTQPYLNDGKTPGYAILNFETSYKLDKGLTLRLIVNNVLDRKFYSASRLGVTPFSPSIYGAIGPSGFNYNSKDWQNTNFVAPGAPRAAWLTLTYDFNEGK